MITCTSYQSIDWPELGAHHKKPEWPLDNPAYCSGHPRRAHKNFAALFVFEIQTGKNCWRTFGHLETACRNFGWKIITQHHQCRALSLSLRLSILCQWINLLSVPVDKWTSPVRSSYFTRGAPLCNPFCALWNTRNPHKYLRAKSERNQRKTCVKQLTSKCHSSENESQWSFVRPVLDLPRVKLLQLRVLCKSFLCERSCGILLSINYTSCSNWNEREQRKSRQYLSEQNCMLPWATVLKWSLDKITRKDRLCLQLDRFILFFCSFLFGQIWKGCYRLTDCAHDVFDAFPPPSIELLWFLKVSLR